MVRHRGIDMSGMRTELDVLAYHGGVEYSFDSFTEIWSVTKDGEVINQGRGLMDLVNYMIPLEREDTNGR